MSYQSTNWCLTNQQNGVLSINQLVSYQSTNWCLINQPNYVLSINQLMSYQSTNWCIIYQPIDVLSINQLMSYLSTNWYLINQPIDVLSINQMMSYQSTNWYLINQAIDVLSINKLMSYQSTNLCHIYQPIGVLSINQLMSYQSTNWCLINQPIDAVRFPFGVFFASSMETLRLVNHLTHFHQHMQFIRWLTTLSESFSIGQLIAMQPIKQWYMKLTRYWWLKIGITTSLYGVSLVCFHLVHWLVCRNVLLCMVGISKYGSDSGIPVLPS